MEIRQMAGLVHTFVSNLKIDKIIATIVILTIGT